MINPRVDFLGKGGESMHPCMYSRQRRYDPVALTFSSHFALLTSRALVNATTRRNSAWISAGFGAMSIFCTSIVSGETTVSTVNNIEKRGSFMKDRNKEQGGICHTKKERRIERNTYFQTCSLPRSRLSSVALASEWGVCPGGGVMRH